MCAIPLDMNNMLCPDKCYLYATLYYHGLYVFRSLYYFCLLLQKYVTATIIKLPSMKWLMQKLLISTYNALYSH